MKIFKKELKHIQNFIFDVDGVFTDGSILIHEDGSMLRTMNTKDGYAIKAALQAGFRVCIISGGTNPAVQKRLNDLGVTDVYLGIHDKASVLETYFAEYNLKASESLLQGLAENIRAIQEDIGSITNYFIIQQNVRQKQTELKEQELAKQEDFQQKQIDNRQKGVQDELPFGKQRTNLMQSLTQGVTSLASDAVQPFINPSIFLGLSFLAGFKDGGEPPINQPSIVGEEGPEIFVPKVAGTILPNNITNQVNTSNFASNFTNNFLAQNIQNKNQTNVNKKINTQALLNTISAAEGTAKGGYGTIYGGTDDNPITVPELAAGEMTINQVLNMMRTGKIERTRMVENDKGEMVEEKYMADVGYGKENNVGATGKYQFIPAALEEEVGVMMGKDKNFSYDTKFTPEVQDKLMLQRLKEKRNIDFDKLNKEGLTTRAIDKLSEEFESFPNLLPGPRKDDLGPVKGRTDQSFYDIKGDKAPVRSEEFIKSVFESQVDKLTLPPNEDLSAITLPPISSGGNDEPIETTSPTFETSNSQSDQITGTESGIAFIDVISNPFLSVV